MTVALIVAMDAENGIGKNNDLMWDLPSDMKFFKEKTSGHVVIMGRKNYDSIPDKYRPLPNRENVVLTQNTTFEAPNCAVFHDLDTCLAHYKKEGKELVYIIGGGQIYAQALKLDVVDIMYITHVDKIYEAETFFPEVDETHWKVNTILEHPKDEKHEAAFVVKKYVRA
jgi:dihydrofolate reductase